MTTDNWLDAINFNSDGLLPAIAQDVESGKVLMMAWMNREALKRTVESKTAVYYSRSRGKLWHKGETSGHTQKVHDIYLDCDADVLILSVTQIGGIACHTGRQSCFYRKLDLSQATPTWQSIAPVLKDPNEIYGHSTPSDDTAKHASIKKTHTAQSITDGSLDDPTEILNALDKVLDDRKRANPDSSYVANLYAKGINKILEKVGEESVEAIIAAKDLSTYLAAYKKTNTEANHTQTQLDHDAQSQDNTQQTLTDDVVYEIADMWFHTIVTLAWFNIPSQRILDELARRFGLSGIAEKASRNH